MDNKILHTLWWAIWFGISSTIVVMVIVAPEYKKFILALIFISLLILASLLYSNRRVLSQVLKTKYFKNMLSNLTTIFLVAGILGMFNYLVFKNNFHFDLTKQKVHTLSDQSKSILNDIKESIKFTLFARRQNWERYLNLLNLYKYESDKVSIEIIDVDTRPSLAKLNNITEEGATIIEYLGKKATVSASSELAVTNMIIKLMRSKNIVVYYTKGHGELKRNQQDQNGADYLFKKIEDTNYTLRSLDLLKVEKVPEDANLLMILGPQDGFLDLEISLLEKYLDRGGHLLLTLAPEMNEVKLTSFYKLLDKFGVKFVNSIVLDRLSTVQGTQATIPIITEFNPSHSITKRFKGKVLFPLTAAIIPRKENEIIYTPLLKSNNFPASWAETSFEELKGGRATFDEKDLKGPIDVAAALENQKTNSRIVITTSSSFIVNGYQSQSTNFNLFLNMLSWGVDDEGIISLNRPGLSDEKIILSASQITLIFYFAIGFFPFILFAISINFVRRRLKK